MISVPNVEILTVIDYLTSEPLTEYMHATSLNNRKETRLWLLNIRIG